ncbi:hypothetical protein PTI98_000934 [Pleurotus ostreatus]|nr:hypothetical protein PTI98_000934 [Pleurotus ostreatus]
MFYLFLVIPVHLALASAQKYLAPQTPLSFVGDTNTLALSSSCPFDSPVSCHNSTAERNLCCFEAPGGLLLQTQFWDTAPPTGPTDSWTIHGLWPDNCDTSFEQNCDPSRAYTNIPSLLIKNEAADVLEFIRQYWVDINGQNERFWEHEWSKHGTCMSTLEPKCLPAGSSRGAEVDVLYSQQMQRITSFATGCCVFQDRGSPFQVSPYI